jgi:hypothetical protein
MNRQRDKMLPQLASTPRLTSRERARRQARLQKFLTMQAKDVMTESRRDCLSAAHLAGARASV